MSAKSIKHNNDTFVGIRIEMPDAVIIIEPILSEEAYYDKVPEIDVEYASNFGNAQRRASFLAWRNVVRSEVGSCTIDYNEVGAPVITDKPLHIGVSHTSNAAAIIISHRRCAIDIENRGRNYSVAAPRFITNAEASLPCAGHPDFQAIVWCAKETLYKISERRELDFLANLHVTSVDLDAMTATGEICGNNGDCKKYDMRIISEGSIIGVFAMGE